MLRPRTCAVLVLLLMSACEAPGPFAALKLYESQEGFSYREVVITSADGTELSANVFVPSTESNQVLPAVVFTNSWVLEAHEYFVPALTLVNRGYIVLNYSSRGWGFSEGKVQVAGPGDIEDVKAVLDWLQQNTPVDMDNIGMAGISYGGGISLIGLATDNRIKTAVSMSGWADLANSLYAGQTPALVWSVILLGTGYLAGDMDPVILEMYSRLLAHEDIDTVLAWAENRSPKNYIDMINRRGSPVYLSNNFNDDLFRPNETLRMYDRLEVPKWLDLNQGIHASAEISGLAGLPNEIWDNVYAWFDHYLQGKPLPAREPVRMQLDHQSAYDSFSDWPSTDIATTRYYLQPPGAISDGELALVPRAHRETKSILSGMDSGASSGFPVVGAALDAHARLPVLSWIPGLNRLAGIVYESERQTADLAIRGIPVIRVRITPSHDKLHMVGYLYDEDALGVGRLITYGPVSAYDREPNQAINLSFELAGTAYDLKEGHRLVLVIDTSDVLYAPPTVLPYSLRFHHDQPMQAYLEIPHRK